MVNVACLQKMALAYVVGHGVRAAVENLFPHTKYKEMYESGGFLSEVRFSIRKKYESSFNWTDRAEFYSAIGAQLPLALVGHVYFFRDPAIRNGDVFAKILFIALPFLYVDFGKRLMQCIAPILCYPLPQKVGKVALKCAKLFYPPKVIFEKGRFHDPDLTTWVQKWPYGNAVLRPCKEYDYYYYPKYH